MTTKPGREYTDDALLAQLAAFLSYAGGGLGSKTWAGALPIRRADYEALCDAYECLAVQPGLEVRC